MLLAASSFVNQIHLAPERFRSSPGAAIHFARPVALLEQAGLEGRRARCRRSACSVSSHTRTFQRVLRARLQRGAAVGHVRGGRGVDLAAVPDRLVALADHDLVGGLRAAAAVAAERPAERGAGVAEAERGGLAVGREPADVSGAAAAAGGATRAATSAAPTRARGSNSLSSLRELSRRSVQNDHNRTQVTVLRLPSARGRRGAADVVRAGAPAAAVARDARSVRAAGERGDAPADPGAAGGAVLRALARALPVGGRARGRARARRAGAVERARLQPPRAGAAARGARSSPCTAGRPT